MIVFSENSQRQPPPPSQMDTDRISEILRMLGCRVIDFPVMYEADITHEDILAMVAPQDTPTPGLYNGFIPTMDQYTAMYEACATKNIWLLNTPEQCARALSLQQAYPYIKPWTPASVPIHDVSGIDAAIAQTGLPAFLKGSVKSLKKRGIRSCKATTLEEARQIATALFEHDYFTRGQVLVRPWIELKHSQTTALGFPVAREFRAFLYNNEVLDVGYYWEGTDPLDTLHGEELERVHDIAINASRALDVPYVVIDIGQRTDGQFIVIEPGDAQFAGLSRVNPIKVLNRLVQLLNTP